MGRHLANIVLPQERDLVRFRLGFGRHSPDQHLVVCPFRPRYHRGLARLPVAGEEVTPCVRRGGVSANLRECRSERPVSRRQCLAPARLSRAARLCPNAPTGRASELCRRPWGQAFRLSARQVLGARLQTSTGFRMRGGIHSRKKELKRCWTDSRGMRQEGMVLGCALFRAEDRDCTSSCIVLPNRVQSGRLQWLNSYT